MANPTWTCTSILYCSKSMAFGSGPHFCRQVDQLYSPGGVMRKSTSWMFTCGFRGVLGLLSLNHWGQSGKISNNMKLCKFEARAKIPILLHKALISHTQSKFIISIRASLGEDGGWLDGYRYYWVGITGTKLLQLLSKGKDLYDVMIVYDL